jgi:hypothetical protein
MLNYQRVFPNIDPEQKYGIQPMANEHENARGCRVTPQLLCILQLQSISKINNFRWGDVQGVYTK